MTFLPSDLCLQAMRNRKSLILVSCCERMASMYYVDCACADIARVDFELSCLALVLPPLRRLFCSGDPNVCSYRHREVVLH